MANVVAELFVTLGIDGSAVNKQLEKTEGDMKSLGERAHKVGDQIRTGLTNEFYNLVKAAFPFASVTASLVALTKAHQGLYNVEKASREIGIPSQEYAAWGRAAEALGYSAQDAQSSIASLQTSLQEAALTGRSQAAGVLTYLGVSLFKANGQMKTAGETLKDLSKVLSKMPVEKARIYGQMMGLSPSTIALLREGKNLTEELAEAVKNGPTAEDAKKAWEVQKSWNKLTQSGGDLAREILVTLAPALLKVLEVARDVSKFFANNSELVMFGGAALLVSRHLGSLAKAFQLVGAVGAKAILAIGTAMKAHPLLLAITGIVAALYSLGRWFNGESSVVGSLFERIGVKAENLKAIFEAIGKVIEIAFKPITWALNGIGALLNLNASDILERRDEGDTTPAELIQTYSNEGVNRQPREQKPVNSEQKQSETRQPQEKEGTNFADLLKGFSVNSQSPQEVIVNHCDEVKSAQRESMIAPSIVNQNRNTNQTSNTEITNQVTINAPGGNPKEVEKAAMKGVRGGLSDFTGWTAYQESGFNAK